MHQTPLLSALGIAPLDSPVGLAPLTVAELAPLILAKLAQPPGLTPTESDSFQVNPSAPLVPGKHGGMATSAKT